jgi:hypothetical protein
MQDQGMVRQQGQPASNVYAAGGQLCIKRIGINIHSTRSG